MCGSRWKCSELQCKSATTEKSRGVEIQNQLLDDMKTEFQDFMLNGWYPDTVRQAVREGRDARGKVIQSGVTARRASPSDVHA